MLPPPFSQKVIGPDGKYTPAWRDYQTSLSTAVDTNIAPADARFVVTKTNSTLTNETNLGALSAGWLRITTALGIATVASSTPVIYQATPVDPTGTANTTGKMMGLAGAITPVVTGRVHVTISGTIFNATAIADGAKVQIRTGTGAAPANGDAIAGTAAGGLVQYIAATTAQKVPFCLSAIVSGLALTTAIWIDVGLAAITGGTASISDLSICAVEV